MTLPHRGFSKNQYPRKLGNKCTCLVFSLSRIWKREEMMHFEPIPYISSTKAQSILMQLVVLFLWDWMWSKQAFLWIKFDFILNYFEFLWYKFRWFHILILYKKWAQKLNRKIEWEQSKYKKFMFQHWRRQKEFKIGQDKVKLNP